MKLNNNVINNKVSNIAHLIFKQTSINENLLYMILWRSLYQSGFYKKSLEIQEVILKNLLKKVHQYNIMQHQEFLKKGSNFTTSEILKGISLKIKQLTIIY